MQPVRRSVRCRVGDYDYDGDLDLVVAGYPALATLPELSGKSGSITITHDGGYAALTGKAVSLDPAVGASFDSPLEWKPAP